MVLAFHTRYGILLMKYCGTTIIIIAYEQVPIKYHFCAIISDYVEAKLLALITVTVGNTK